MAHRRKRSQIVSDCADLHAALAFDKGADRLIDYSLTSEEKAALKVATDYGATPGEIVEAQAKVENAEVFARQVKGAFAHPATLIIDYTNGRLAEYAKSEASNSIRASRPGGVATTASLPVQVVTDYQLYAFLLLKGAKHG